MRQLNFNIMKRTCSNQRGIALVMVLAAIAVLSMIAIEFVFDTNINYRLALNEKERLNAYYLAKSAINLMRLELKFDKAYRSMLAGSAASQYMTSNLGGPLCQQIPMSTALLRGVFLGGGEGGAEEGAVAPEGESEEALKIKEAKEAVGTSFEEGTAKQFLEFEGDFEGDCKDEQTKFNLNVFFGQDPAQQVLSGLNSYDSFKQLLYQFLSNDKYKELFGERRDEEIKNAVKNIADWVDKNEEVNEAAGSTMGRELAVYAGRKDETKIKNTKFLTLDELYLVEGVKDDWFTTLKDDFTIYGDNKVDVCLASDDVVSALILQYVSNNPKIPPISPTNKEKLSQLVTAVKNACVGANPSPQQIAQALDQALGVTQEATGAQTTLPQQQPTTTTPATTSSESTGFASLITTTSRFYSLKGTGRLKDTVVNIVTVVDANSTNPKSWKTLYWRVE